LDCDKIIKIQKINDEDDFPKEFNKEDFINFLYHHLGQYGDKKKDIERALDYAFSSDEGKGGFILVALEDDEIVGGVLMNDTAMKGYIPEHILVYIATHENHRGKGIGTKLLKQVFKECDGDVALHVEYDNPALRLYKRVGFKSKYAEMRYQN
jgi:GNAT superfamily N-acetyltransferase